MTVTALDAVSGDGIVEAVETRLLGGTQQAERRGHWLIDGVAVLSQSVFGEPLPAPVSKIALHVVPVGWVSARRPTPTKKMPALDLSWSWADVVAFGEPDAAGSLAEHKTEGQRS